MAVRERDLVRVATLPPAEESATLRLRAWLRGQIEGEDSVDQSALAERALEHFLSNTAFMQALTRELLPAMVYRQVQLIVGSGRRAPDAALAESPEEDDEPAHPNTLGSAHARERSIKAGQPATRSKWDRWLEHVGSKHVRLTVMTKADLRKARAQRGQRGRHELVIERFEEILENGMETEWETVGQRFSTAELDAAFAQALMEKGK